MEKIVAIIGAGPVGLAAAAHVMERGMTPVVLEAGPEGRALDTAMAACTIVFAMALQRR